GDAAPWLRAAPRDPGGPADLRARPSPRTPLNPQANPPPRSRQDFPRPPAAPGRGGRLADGAPTGDVIVRKSLNRSPGGKMGVILGRSCICLLLERVFAGPRVPGGTGARGRPVLPIGVYTPLSTSAKSAPLPPGQDGHTDP